MASTSIVTLEADQMEGAIKLVEKHMEADNNYFDLAHLLKINSHNSPSSSGLTETDYPVLSDPRLGLRDLPELSAPKHTALPPEIVEQFNYMQCSSVMGLFPDISRAWVAIDSDLFMWNFKDGSDLAFFDGLTETILCAALIPCCEGVFQPHIRSLLALCTPVEVVLLGVSFTPSSDGRELLEELHLIPEPLFSVPSDNTHFMSITGTSNGRVFLAGKDGCLYELTYQAQEGWFSRRCQLINHSVSKLSFFLPSFLNFSLAHDDAMVQIVVDESRHVLYTRSEHGAIQMFDLGADGKQASRVAALASSTISSQAAAVARTVEKNHFEKLVHIAAITTRESTCLHLVAITESGCRLYFCGAPFNRAVHRPNMLHLVSVRLPPGFSAALHQPKPNKVHKAFYNEGLLLLAACQSDETDLLWSISADSFPFHSQLREALATLPIAGKVWSLAQLPGWQPAFASGGRCAPPLVVWQHLDITRQLVILTDKGTYTLQKLRPVDQFRHLLRTYGAESDEVRAFFSLHHVEQVCATTIIAASSQLLSETVVKESATSALFRYGGEPEFIQQPQQQFSGLNASGLQSTSNSSWLCQTGDVHFSHRFNGIVLVLARIMRSLWSSPMVCEAQITVRQGVVNKLLRSSHSPGELAECRTQITALKKFVLENIQTQPQPLPNINVTPTRGGSALIRPNIQERMSDQQRARLRAEASNAERQALLQLLKLMDRCAELIGLWQILSEHDFHQIASTLSRDQMTALQSCTLQSLLGNNSDLAQFLIQALIQQYIGDNASTDHISDRLRDLAPNLYSTDDANCSKANELLATARITSNKAEQDQLLNQALRLYKQVAPVLDLPGICSQFSSCHHYSAVLDLCLCTAAKRDPGNLALSFYSRGQPAADQHGQEAFYFRMDCYRCVIETLEQLQQAAQGHLTGGKPGELTAQIKQPTAVVQLQQMYDELLRSPDQLLHIALFEWLLNTGQSEKLLQLESSHVEGYLKAQCEADVDNLNVWGLLWRLLEKQKSYSEAAHILASLAERQSRDIQLRQRVEFLSRAIVCAKSASLAATQSHASLLLDLQDKMEVCRVQQQLYSALESKQGISEQQRADCLAQLNSQLLDISTLFSEFAEPFDLTEIKLSIVHCANHYDPGLIESLWREIIENELNAVISLTLEAQMNSIQQKMLQLGHYYSSSQRFFPLSHIVLCLEEVSCRQRFTDGWALKHVLLPLEIPLSRLRQIYDAKIKTRERFWTEMGEPWHLIKQLTYLLDTFTKKPTLVPDNERHAFVSSCLDSAAVCLVELCSSADKQAQTLVSDLRRVQSQLKIMDNAL